MVIDDFEDVSTPVSDIANECECTIEGPDGYFDLTLRFNAQEIVVVLGEVNNGDLLPLTIIGVDVEGMPIEGTDCVVIIAKGGVTGKAREGIPMSIRCSAAGSAVADLPLISCSAMICR